MIRLFVTGDVHIGKIFASYPENIKEQLIESRFACLQRCVERAEEEQCDFFVITGDLFDRTYGIRKRDVEKVVDILSEFGGRVIVLPGNHDFYTGEEKVWKDFCDALDKTEHHVFLIKEYKRLVFDVGDEIVSFYPAFCGSKKSKENKLGWIKEQKFDDTSYHVGLAHGTLVGLSPDLKNQYFQMTQKELNDIPVDAWLIGHTHIPYPAGLSEDGDSSGYTIFNAGTPEQTDFSNNTSGVSFVVTLDHSSEKTVVNAHRYQSGDIRFYDVSLEAKENLRKEILALIRDLTERSVVRLTIKGTVPKEEYDRRQQIYEEVLGRFLDFKIRDAELSERITVERIRSEFAEIGFASKVLEELLSDPVEVQMAYNLLKKHQS